MRTPYSPRHIHLTVAPAAWIKLPKTERLQAYTEVCQKYNKFECAMGYLSTTEICLFAQLHMFIRYDLVAAHLHVYIHTNSRISHVYICICIINQS